MTVDDGLTPGQRQALDEVREIAETDPAAIEILRIGHPVPSGGLPILVSVGTAEAAEGVSSATGPRGSIRARERFLIDVPRGFPFVPPRVYTTHDRFAGLPHVQWRRHLCLYISPTTEWQPADGMFGFLDRVLLWVARAAEGTLDPAGEPLHPPVAYGSADVGVVVRVNTPPVHESAWLGFAVLRPMSDARVDLVGWVSGEDLGRLLATDPTHALATTLGLDPDTAQGAPLLLGLAVLLPGAIAYEFPVTAHALVDMLADQGVDKDALLAGFTLMAYANRCLMPAPSHGQESPVYVVVGTPMRGLAGGERRQHLAAWRLVDLGEQIVGLLDTVFSDVDGLASLGARARDLIGRWLDIATVDWVRVHEDRPEVTTRRDRDSPLELVRGRRALVLGCGAIGGRVAEHLVRAGIARLVLVDNGRVSPGVLVRQPYDDADIGRWKVEALADRLRRIRPDMEIDARMGDALDVVLGDGSPLPDVDVIVDAAANPAVASLLERRRRERTERGDVTPPILSFLLGHTACRAVATVAPTDFSGGGVDLLRKVKLATLVTPGLRAVADDFFPDPPRVAHFQPEPGCSEATFAGSDVEVGALTAQLLVHALAACRPSANPAVGRAILVDLGLDAAGPAMTHHLEWPADVVVRDVATGVDVRLAPAAVAEMRAECRLMTRRRDARVETGGPLLGEIDDACGVVWVSVAAGPPPDSRASATLFVCGVEGVEKMIDRRDQATRGAERFLGLWHSHPAGWASPSEIDEVGMRTLLVPVARAPRRALLLIVGAPPGTVNGWAAWLGDTDGGGVPVPAFYARLCRRPPAMDEEGGMADKRYARAIAEANGDTTRRWPTPDDRRLVRRWPWPFYQRRVRHGA